MLTLVSAPSKSEQKTFLMVNVPLYLGTLLIIVIMIVHIIYNRRGEVVHLLLTPEGLAFITIT